MCAGCHTLAKWLSAVSGNEASGFSSLLLFYGRSIKLSDVEKCVKKRCSDGKIALQIHGFARYAALGAALERLWYPLVVAVGN
jgi:hypothetical protein